MDIASHIPGIARTANFETGPNTPAPFKGTHTGLTDGTSPIDSSRNMAEIYNRLLFAHDAAILQAGLAVDHDNWAQLGQAMQAIATAAMPKGCIVLWSGAIADVPTGWQLCDGTNGAPDLRDRFVLGAGNSYAVGDTGGSKDAVVVEHQHTGGTTTNGWHSHSLTTYFDGGIGMPFRVSGDDGSYNGLTMTNVPGVEPSGDHSHSFTTSLAGQSGTDANLPPYYALAYIQKV